MATGMGLYRASIKERRQDSRARLKRVQDSFDSLQNQESTYGREHAALLELYFQVAMIFKNAPDEIDEI